jgi:hypothetical protein
MYYAFFIMAIAIVGVLAFLGENKKLLAENQKLFGDKQAILIETVKQMEKDATSLLK